MLDFKLAENPTERNTPVFLSVDVSTAMLPAIKPSCCTRNRPSRYPL